MMTKRISNESGIALVLQEIIDKNKWQLGLDEVNVKEAWRKLMGNGVNNYTKNILLKGSTLYVELNSSVLRQELSFGKDKIVKLLNDELEREVVKSVVLR